MKKIDLNSQTLKHWRWIMADHLRQLPYLIMVRHITIVKGVIAVFAVILTTYLVISLVFFVSSDTTTMAEPISLSVTHIERLLEWLEIRSQGAAAGWSVADKDYFTARQTAVTP